MSDPFRPNVNKQLMREARIGMTILCCLLCVLVYLAYYKMSGKGTKLPEHVANAPIAKMVWPENYTPTEKTQPTRHSPQPGSQRVEQNAIRNSNEPIANHPPTADQHQQPSSMANHATTAIAANQPPAIELDSQKIQSWNQNFVDQKPIGASDDSIARNKPIDHPKLKVQQAETSRTFEVAGQDRNSPVDNVLRNSPVVDDPFVHPATAEFPIPSSYPPANDQLPPHRTAQDIDPHEILPLVEENSFKPKPSTNAFVPKQTPNISQVIPSEKDQSAKSPIGLGDDNLFKLGLKPAANNVPEFKPIAMRPATQKEVALSSSVASDEIPQTLTKNHDSANHDSTNQSTEYTVRPGDDFWTISKEAYGDPRFFRALFAHNQKLYQSDFNELTPGTKISIPTKDDLCREWASHCPQDQIDRSTVNQGKRYVTRAGQTLYEIAREELGQAALYVQLMKWNQTVLPTDCDSNSALPAGIELTIRRN